MDDNDNPFPDDSIEINETEQIEKAQSLWKEANTLEDKADLLLEKLMEKLWLELNSDGPINPNLGTLTRAIVRDIKPKSSKKSSESDEDLNDFLKSLPNYRR